MAAVVEKVCSSLWVMVLLPCLVFPVSYTEKQTEAECPSWWSYVQYPLFRTPSQQARYYKQFLDAQTLTTVEESTKYTRQNCSFSCTWKPERPPVYLRRPDDVRERLTRQADDTRRLKASTLIGISHGCCISSLDFYNPSVAKSSSGDEVSLVQLGGQFGHQYFPRWTCQHAKDCEGCTCRQETGFYTALVFRGRSAVLDTIQLPGCCKCFN